MAHLPRDVGLLAIDVRGRGKSWDSPAPYGIETVAGDIALAMDQFELDQAILAGYSMGAWLAAFFAKRHSRRVTRVVMVDGGLPVPYDDTLDPEELLDAVVGPSLRRLEMRFNTLDDYVAYYKTHPAFGPIRSSELRPILEYELKSVGKEMKVRANREAVVVSGADITLNPDVVEAGITIGVPTTAVVVDHGMLGQLGGFIPLEVVNAAAAGNPNLTYILLEGINHYTVMLGEGAPAVATAIMGSG